MRPDMPDRQGDKSSVPYTLIVGSLLLLGIVTGFVIYKGLLMKQVQLLEMQLNELSAKQSVEVQRRKAFSGMSCRPH